MLRKKFFTYAWHNIDDQEDVTSIRVYGLNESNKTVCIRVDNFTPFVYLELPTHIKWDNGKAQMLGRKIDEMLGEFKPINKYLMFKQRLYYANIDKNGNRKKFPYLMCSFSTKDDIKKLSYKINRPLRVLSLGYIKVKMHEQDASPILQFTSLRNIPTAGWVEFNGKPVAQHEKVTICDEEYRVQWKNTRPINSNAVVKPLILNFDIEVNSTNPSAMPKASNPGDKIFQISCVLSRDGQSATEYKTFLLTLGDPDEKTVGGDVTILRFKNEHDLLIGFTEFIKKYNPHIITGYNIMGFDIPYMIDRAKHNLCIYDFDQQGFAFGHAKEKTIKWSSSAYKNQTFQFLDAEGRLYVDLLPLVKRDYKMSNYRLKTVATYFIGQTKDDLSPKGIFKCYRLGIKKEPDGSYSDTARKAMGVVGKYCVKDSILVARLFEKLQTWIGLCEMGKTCNVPIFYLYTQGQQIKVYSQVYKYCMYKNFIVEKNGYIPAENEHYQGATVFDPIPGVYDRVVPFDFASLYPTTIIAYNIDFSTLVTDDTIPDEMCHVMEWEDHVGCEHDTTVRKTKPKHVMCCNRRYRFLKSPKGVLPTILQNLLDARKHTRSQIKVIKCLLNNQKVGDEDKKLVEGMFDDLLEKKTLTVTDKNSLNTLINVLNKRQLAYKVSANSMYGAMGVSRGYLPFMPGAMATTAMGRKSIELVAKVIPRDFGGKLIYGDTDSNYIVFPKLLTSEETWDYSEKVASEVTKLFPSPMKLEFEEVIYWRFLILTKKRYMSLSCQRDGILSSKISKKGVLLARRDNSAFVRTLYADVTMKIFNREPRDEVLYYIINEINKLCSGTVSYENFVVTKSIGDTGGMKPTPTINDKGQRKALLGDYTVPILSTDADERLRQFKLKDCDNPREYYERCLPAQVQLAERMRRRGQRVAPGSRLEYVITRNGGHKAKQYKKVESAEYFGQHRDVLRIDYLYYLKLLTNPLDQLLDTAYLGKEKKGEHKFVRNFTLNQYNYRVKIREKMLTELGDMFRPGVVFE